MYSKKGGVLVFMRFFLGMEHRAKRDEVRDRRQRAASLGTKHWGLGTFRLWISDCARPPRLSEQARDGGQGLRI
jgi:hypothetical protein